MRRTLLKLCVTGLISLMVTMTVEAAKPVDNDGDGVTDNRDCNDNDPSVWDLNSCGVCAPEPLQGCDPICTDNDQDGYAQEGGSCGLVDCNDNDMTIYPGAAEICGDGVDQSCSGFDQQCGTAPHADLTWSDYPSSCIDCHNGGEGGNQYADMFASTHYQWQGEAPEMTHGPLVQGKLTNAINNYCINIQSNWNLCGSCHAGRGEKPAEGVGIDNVDCLVCHNEVYAMARVRKADGSMGPPDGLDQATLDGYVQNLQPPTRANCLKCHAKAGGGDGVKRGDLSLALIDNVDDHFDVHMNVLGPDLTCQDCHVFEQHRVIGKGSDLRPTDDIVRGSEVSCVTCHTGMDSGTGHSSAGRRNEPDRHVARVACQSCHIPTYAKWETEVHREWEIHHDGSTAHGATTTPGHPHSQRASNLTPVLKFWNRFSFNALLSDPAQQNPVTGRYPTSYPMGDISDGMLTPFKYKTARQPKVADVQGALIAIDTNEYISGSGNIDLAIENGLALMGLPSTTPYEWVETETYQMINHGVNPVSDVADCTYCHQELVDLSSDSMLDLLGYRLKGVKEEVCNQCHDGTKKLPRTWDKMHSHVDKGTSGIGCYFCHDFDRPERGLCSPCDPSCSSEYVDNIPYPHQCGG